MDGWMDMDMDMDGWIWMDGWMDRGIDGRMDRRTDGFTVCLCMARPQSPAALASITGCLEAVYTSVYPKNPSIRRPLRYVNSQCLFIWPVVVYFFGKEG